MSTLEYNDLFLKCQDTGLYHVFSFDIKDSKSLKNRYEVQEKLIKMILNIYKRIKEKEQQENKISHDHNKNKTEKMTKITNISANS